MYDEDKTLIDEPLFNEDGDRPTLEERRARREMRRLSAGRGTQGTQTQAGFGAAERPGRPIDPHRILRALKRGRWWLVLGLCGGVVLGAVLWKFVFPREFAASTTLQFEGSNPEDSPLPPDPTELRTLIDSIKTPSNLQKIKERNDLGGTLRMVAARFDVQHDQGSNVVTIMAKADSAQGSADLTNSVVEVFLEDRRRLDREHALEMVESKDRELEGAVSELNRARNEYNTFRRTHGISDLDAEQQAAIQQAADLLSQARQAETEASAAGAQLDTLRRGTSPASRVTQRGTAQQRSQLSAKRRELSEARAALTDDHPRVRALQAEIAQLERGMETTTTTSTGGNAEDRRQFTTTQLSRAAAEERQANLERLAQEARERVSALSEIEGQASNLLAAVHVQQARVTRIRAERSEWQDIANNPQTGFRVLAEAYPPEDPEATKLRYAVVIGPGVVLALIALFVFLGKEIGKLRPHTASEVAYWGNSPVVGASTWPRNGRALSDLVDEMDDFLLDATGRTLVVPASEKEAQFVGPLADRLGEDGWAPTTFIGCVGESLPELEDDLDPDSIQPGTALALRDNGERGGSLAPIDGDGPVLDAQPWIGPMTGPSLRRAARLADRVLVVVQAGSMSGPELAQIKGRLGREDGVGYVVVGLDEDFVGLPDRAGDVDDFWDSYRGNRDS